MTSTKTRPWYVLPLVGLLVVTWALTGCGKEEPTPVSGADPRPPGITEAMGGPGVIDVCIVCDSKLDAAKTVNYEHKGRTIRTCSDGCVAKLKDDAGSFVTKLDELAKKKIQGN